jgi:hypothetical protein
MGYAQPVKSPNGDYYLGRYLDSEGKYATVKDPDTGKSVHFTGKRDAKKAADAREAAVREGRETTASARIIMFAEWANQWYASLDLAPATMENYKEHLELHLLPHFQDRPMTAEGFLPFHVSAWEKQMRDEGRPESSIGTYRSTLQTCLQSAVPAIIPANPAAKNSKTGRRGTRRPGTAGSGKKEKVITTVLGGLLIAERVAILSGRDDEFILTATLQHAMLRLGEGIGLERQYASREAVDVQWQLSEVRGQLFRGIPKFGSRGTVIIPPFLGDLLMHQADAAPAVECPCHAGQYLFRGTTRRGRDPKPGVTIWDVAAAAAVTPVIVNRVLDEPEKVTAPVRRRVGDAIRQLGWQPGSAPADGRWHWRRWAYEELFTAAASGRWAIREKTGHDPVLAAGEWPGIRIMGRGKTVRAEWCWAPVADGMTPHGQRHSGRTFMEENRVHHVLAEQQLRHFLGGVEVYRHVTDAMRQEYRGLVQAAWEEALQRRGELAGWSPVAVLDGLLRAASGGRGKRSGTVSRKKFARTRLQAIAAGE